MGAAATFKLKAVGIIVISFIVGFAFFYITSPLQKELKKAQLEEMFSQLVNFIIFIWVGKIILNFSIFINDPLAILAYPSNSDAFYIAILLSAILLFYKNWKKKLNVIQLITSFLPVFLVASFLYEFIQMMLDHNTFSFGYLTLSTILLVLFLLIHEHLTSGNLILVMLVSWSLGILVLVYTQPFVTIFGYIMAPWFIVLFLITNLLFILGER
ncbi:MAG TPA: hypothetical protein VK135_08275 [Candidatus Dormibacteraeota bacterium]|nr:hypothetical protein [Candidatus Dormibacteraeota bacterium]